MKKLKKLFAFTAAVTTTIISLTMASFSASAAYSYNDYYDTYRFYAELTPASGMSASNVLISYPRALTNQINSGNTTTGNIGGTYSIAGTANDNWVTHVDIFIADSPSGVVNGGTLYRWDCYTKVAVSNVWDLFRLSDGNVMLWDSNGKSISSSFISVYGVKVGDINEDGIVDWNDIMCLNNFMMGNTILTGNPLRAADTDNNGTVDNRDLNVLISYLNGDIEHF